MEGEQHISAGFWYSRQALTTHTYARLCQAAARELGPSYAADVLRRAEGGIEITQWPGRADADVYAMKGVRYVDGYHREVVGNVDSLLAGPDRVIREAARGKCSLHFETHGSAPDWTDAEVVAIERAFRSCGYNCVIPLKPFGPRAVAKRVALAAKWQENLKRGREDATLADTPVEERPAKRTRTTVADWRITAADLGEASFDSGLLAKLLANMRAEGAGGYASWILEEWKFGKTVRMFSDRRIQLGEGAPPAAMEKRLRDGMASYHYNRDDVPAMILLNGDDPQGVDFIWVAKAWRGLGYARALIEKYNIQRARVDDPETINFFKARGFHAYNEKSTDEVTVFLAKD